MKEQTAIEWLKMQLEIRSGIKEITVDSKTFEELCEQAKEMEKIKENNFNKMLEMLKEIKNQIEDGRTYITKEDMEQLIKEVTEI